MKKNYMVRAGKAWFAIKATSRRTALVAVMLEMFRSGRARLLDFDAETVARWSVVKIEN